MRAEGEGGEAGFHGWEARLMGSFGGEPVEELRLELESGLRGYVVLIDWRKMFGDCDDGNLCGPSLRCFYNVS
jgi:hypothetical protein